MSEKPKKPPISIDDLNKRVEAKQGPLSYAGNDKGNGKEKRAPREVLAGFNFAQILIAAVIAVGLAALMLFMFAPSKGTVSDMQTTVNALQTAVSDVDSDVSSLYGQISSLNSDIAGLATSSALASLSAQIDGLEDEFGDLEEELRTQVEDAIASMPATNSLDYWLEGDGSSYTLTVVSDRAGEYVGRVTLVYAPPVYLVHEAYYDEALFLFYSQLDDTNRNFQCGIIDDGYVSGGYWIPRWELVEVTFNTFGFRLEAGVEETFSLAISGLGEFSNYSEIYIEVLPGSVIGEATGPGI